MKKLVFVFCILPLLFACNQKSSESKKHPPGAGPDHYGSSKMSSGFDQLCIHASEFDWTQKIDKQDMLNKFAEHIKAKLANTNALQAVEALVSFSESDPGERYELLQESARELDASQFDCQVLKENF